MFRFFEKLINPFPDNEAEIPPQRLTSFILFNIKEIRLILIAIACLSAMIAILEVSLFEYLGQLIDWFSTRDKNTFISEEKYNLMLMAVVLIILLPTLIFIQSLIKNQAFLGNYLVKLIWSGHKYLLNQSMSYFENEVSGRIATKLMQSSTAIREAVSKLVDIFVYVSIYFISIMWVVVDIDWRLTLPLLIWITAYLLILKKLLPKLKQISREHANVRADMMGQLVDCYTNISTVKLFSNNIRETSYIHKSMKGFLDKTYPLLRTVTILNFSVWLSIILLIFSMSVMSIYLWIKNIASAGNVAVAVGLSLRLNGMAQWIMWEVSSLFENLGTIQDGINSLTLPFALKDKPNAQELRVTGGEIIFDNVSFRYFDEKPVIKNISIKIKKGEKVGIVGRSGAGKSTLVKLLLRFYDLNSGEIKIDGFNITDVTQESLRGNISVVSQDVSLLNRSIKENILYGFPEASDDQLYLASNQANSHEFINEMCDGLGRTGYEMHVGERGVRVSGGQKQRIAIARIILKDAPILILDEATSSLDSEVEDTIYNSLNSLIKDKTVLVVAHRLATISLLDRLIVIDDGRVVETGSHNELLNLDGVYAKLWAHQSAGYLGLD